MNWIMFAAAVASMQSWAVGRTYDEAIRGGPNDPAIQAPERARTAFAETLTGPQTPGVTVTLRGREIVIYEACARDDCAFNHSVIAIDPKTREVYAAIYGDNPLVVMPNPGLAALVDGKCAVTRCYLTGAMGAPFTPEPLRPGDTKHLPGGATCETLDKQRRVIIHSEGEAVMRFNGRLRHLHEDGIGTPSLYSTDGPPEMVVQFTSMPSRWVDLEMSERPAIMSVLMNNRLVSTPVIIRCTS